MPNRVWWALRPWQRHSLVLSVAAFFYAAYGVTYIALPQGSLRAASLELPRNLMPLWAWGFLWVSVGVGALLSTRWPPWSKTWGYVLLAGMATLWGSQYLLGVLLLNTPATSLSGALVWYLVAFIWWAISGLVNPDDIPDGG